jgi:hypothetical protein
MLLRYRFSTLAFLVTVYGVVAGTAEAHQPRFPGPGVSVVNDPDISQAWYAELGGEPAEYVIHVPDSLLLYVGVLVPRIPYVTEDYTAAVYAESNGVDEVVFVLDGPNATWADFFEPFAGDHYRQGPEKRVRVGPGTYKIVVSNTGNKGKYVLAIGERESFPPGEAARTIGQMPRLKRYFGKSVWTSYFNLSGVFVGVSAALVAGIVVLAVSLARR